MEASTPAPRRVLPIVIVVLAVVIGFVSVLALWVKRQALETDTWTETSTELLENETIRNAVADFAVNALYDNVDVQAQIASALPPRLQPLAGPAAGGLRQATTEVSQRLLAQPKVQALWEDANRTAHEKLLALLDDEAPSTWPRSLVRSPTPSGFRAASSTSCLPTPRRSRSSDPISSRRRKRESRRCAPRPGS
jgi:hypothetical protein